MSLLDNELALEHLLNEIQTLYPNIYDYMDSLDKSAYCDLVAYTDPHIVGELALPWVDCKMAYHGLMNKGMQNVIQFLTMKLNSIYYEFESCVRIQNKTRIAELLNGESFAILLDIASSYLNAGVYALFMKASDAGFGLFGEIDNFDTYDFVILTLLLILIFMVALRFFLNNFEFSIWKTKRMLGILPTKYMADQLDEIKTLIKEIS